MSRGEVHITFAGITAPCPWCKALFNDADDKIVNACNRNITGLTYRKCKKCGRRVGLTYDITGQLRAFKP